VKEARKVLGFREERRLYSQLDCELEFQLDQPAAHERTEIVAPDEFLKRRILIQMPRRAPAETESPQITRQYGCFIGEFGFHAFPAFLNK
jgi:hypothetical protein